MATISIGQQPGLTKERAQEIFAQHYEGTYEVVRANAVKRDFIIKKNGWTGIGVRLKEEKNGQMTFVFTPLMPNTLLQLAFGGLFAYVLLRKSWKEMELEVASYIRIEPAFLQRGQVEYPPLAKAA